MPVPKTQGGELIFAGFRLFIGAAKCCFRSFSNYINSPAVGELNVKAATTVTVEGGATENTSEQDFNLTVAGKGFGIKEGTNCRMGRVTLVAGTAVVSTTEVTSVSEIFLTAQSLGTITVPVGLAVSARTSGTSFTILSGNLTDTSVIAWEIKEPT